MFVKVTKGKAEPITLTEFRKMYWETSFPQEIPPAMLAEKGVYPARDMNRPTIAANQRATLSEAFTQVDGEWVREWIVADMDAATIKENNHAEVDLERSRRIAVGSSFAVAGLTDPIPLTGRAFDQTVYLALLSRAGALRVAGVTTAALTIRGQDDVIHRLTPDQMISLVGQAMSWFEGVMVASWDMKDGTGNFSDGFPTDCTNDLHWPK